METDSLKEKYNFLVGMTIIDAAKALTLENKVLRVSWNNGHTSLLTQDFQINRINVTVADGKVVDIIGQG